MKQDSPISMLPSERRATFGLAGIFALRMLGLFLLLPVLTLHASEYTDSTPLLIGLALGAYGLTQAFLQIPFGMLSDRFGRKRVIAAGLILFALGSAYAAMADTLVEVVIGRALQGAGAIAAATMALLADLTREENRTKAMAMFGMSIGFAFMLAIVLGPLLVEWIGLSGLFWITGVFALLGLVVLARVVPHATHSHTRRDAVALRSEIGSVLANPQLRRLDFGILVLHLVLTALFVVVPLSLLHEAGLPKEQHGWAYFGVMIASVAIMFPLVLMAERGGRMKHVFVGAIFTLAISMVLLWQLPHSLWFLLGMLVVFFAAFNVLEATLPSLISKTAPVANKGTAMGVYSSSQFFGAFLGGALGGWVLGAWGESSVYLLCAALLLVWGVYALTMAPPARVSTRVVRVGVMNKLRAQHVALELREIRGIVEAVVLAEEGVAYVKYDPATLDEPALAGWVSNPAREPGEARSGNPQATVAT
jgi:MFS family permease